MLEEQRSYYGTYADPLADMVDTYEKVKEDSSGGGRRYPPTDDYEIVEWVWLTPFGELKSDYVEVKLTDDSKKSFIYNNKKFPPGVYYLIRRNGRESLVSESVLKP